MLHIKGVKHIVLPQVNAVIVHDITPLDEPGDSHSYQRVLMISTDQCILAITLIAKERETISFAADPQEYKGPLPPDEEEE
jgi:hypothetical protein